MNITIDNTIALKDLPPAIRTWLRQRRIVLKRIIAIQVNRLHITVKTDRSRGPDDLIHFVLITHIQPGLSGDHVGGPKPGWTFAVGELWRAADRVARERSSR